MATEVNQVNKKLANSCDNQTPCVRNTNIYNICWLGNRIEYANRAFSDFLNISSQFDDIADFCIGYTLVQGFSVR